MARSSALSSTWCWRITSRSLSPTFWQFGIGLMLVLAVLFARRGLLGLFERRRRNISPEGGKP